MDSRLLRLSWAEEPYVWYAFVELWLNGLRDVTKFYTGLEIVQRLTEEDVYKHQAWAQRFSQILTGEFTPDFEHIEVVRHHLTLEILRRLLARRAMGLTVSQLKNDVFDKGVMHMLYVIFEPTSYDRFMQRWWYGNPFRRVQAQIAELVDRLAEPMVPEQKLKKARTA